jgi:hypothetical protein
MVWVSMHFQLDSTDYADAGFSAISVVAIVHFFIAIVCNSKVQMRNVLSQHQKVPEYIDEKCDRSLIVRRHRSLHQ